MGSDVDSKAKDKAQDEARDKAYVYVLGSGGANRYLTYVGWTNDLDRRLAQHNAGTGARSTRGRSWILLHVETFPTRNLAMSREWYLKRDRTFRKQLAQRALATPTTNAMDHTV